MRPLEGLLVLDFSTLLPGPLASLMLAEAGAEVIKIERPGRGDEMRSYEPKWGKDSANFALLNRGKKAIALDLQDPAERAKLRPLVEKADILLEQFRPGVMKRLGLGYDSVCAVNPGVIYCSITGYGQSGPNCGRAGHDLNYIGDTGLLNLSMGPSSNPVLPPALIADIAGGSYPAMINILLAIHERQKTGRGRYLDVAMADNLFTFMYWALGNGFSTGQWPDSGCELVTGGSPRYRLYATSDGRVVAVAALEQKFWETFCELIGLKDDLRDDARSPAKTAEGIATILSAQPAEHWRALFAGKDCCCSVVADLSEALADPHFAARGLFQRVLTNDVGGEMPALPVPINDAFRTPPDVPLTAPGLGYHNKDYFGEGSRRS